LVCVRLINFKNGREILTLLTFGYPSYQRYEKRLVEQKVVQMLMVAMQKYIWNRNYTVIKSVFEYRFNSNHHTHMFLFVTQAFWVFIVRICIFSVKSGII